MRIGQWLLPISAAALCACGAAGDTDTDLAPSEEGPTGTVQQALEVTDKLFADETGTIYATTTDGDLLWFKDLARNGTSNWHGNSGHRIGTGWTGLKFVFSGGQNIIYVVTSTGDLRFYRDNANNGTFGWDAASGNLIGTGWGAFRYVFGDSFGRIYGVSTSGVVSRYEHTGRANGTFSWAAGSGAALNSPLTNYNGQCDPSLFTGSWFATGGNNQTIYMIGYDGALRTLNDHNLSWCFADTAYPGWWSSYGKMTAAGGGGMLYGLAANGSLLWFNYTNEHILTGYGPAGVPLYAARSFAPGSGSAIGGDFSSLHYP